MKYETEIEDQLRNIYINTFSFLQPANFRSECVVISVNFAIRKMDFIGTLIQTPTGKM